MHRPIPIFSDVDPTIRTVGNPLLRWLLSAALLGSTISCGNSSPAEPPPLPDGEVLDQAAPADRSAPYEIPDVADVDARSDAPADLADAVDETASDGADGSDDGGQDVASDADAAPRLPPVPMPDGGYPSCHGMQIPEAGACCEQVYCSNLGDAGSCSAADRLTMQDLIPFSGPSAGCRCGASGPYDPASAPFALGSGRCCYVIGWQSCI